MNLIAKKREKVTKGDLNQIRREGNIPGVFYSSGKKGESIEIDGANFESSLRNIAPNRLSTTLFTLDLGGKKTKVLVKGIQYDLTTYKVIHIDLIEIHEDVPVQVKVPIQCVGVEECVGIKLGGFLRQVIRNVKVRCLPKNIPQQFELNIENLEIKQARRLSDLAIPEGVEPLAVMNEVVCVIAKR